MTRNALRIAVVATVATASTAMGLTVAWRINDRDPEVSIADVAPTPELVSRGEYLVRAADCAACHNVPGGKPFAGGVAFHLPFGTIYSSNITPDRENGIGLWSDDDFSRALHDGIAKDGGHLYPAFPYASYTALSREDAIAMKAYLFTMAPVARPSPPNALAFPFNQRWTLALWNMAFLDPHRFRPDPASTAVENRGRYLATALGHCGECHTPRNPGFATSAGRQFGGAMLQGWHAYNITADKGYGIGDWSDRQVSDYLTTGHAAGRGSAAGPMAEAVEDSLQYLTGADTTALVAFLRLVEPRSGIPGTEVGKAPAAMTASSSWSPGPGGRDRGSQIFAGICASCHQWNGGGRQTTFAALEGSQAVNDPEGINLVRVMLTGANLKTGRGAGYMPRFGEAYSDAELAAVSNYVIAHFGGKVGLVTANGVAQRRSER